MHAEHPPHNLGFPIMWVRDAVAFFLYLYLYLITPLLALCLLNDLY